MRVEDLIMVSVDDHVVEPPNMFDNHVPAKWKDQAPKSVRKPEGHDVWVFEGNEIPNIGLNAVAGRPPEDYDMNVTSYDQIRRGTYDIHERVRDMNVNGVLASMCFPTMAGFNARTFTEAADKDLSYVMLQAYNDWQVDEWCAAHPGRFIPLGIVPMWDVDLAVAEVRRMAKKGFRGVSFLEAPHAQGWPSFLSGHWDPMLEAIIDHDMALCLHIGGGFGLIQLAEEAPVDHQVIIPTQVTMLVVQDLLFGPTFRKYPRLRVALSEGGIGWIPYYLERVDRHFRNQTWIHNDFGGRLPSEVFREHVLACFITDPSGLKARHQIGVDILAWESDYPHTDTTWPESPEVAWSEFQAAGVPDDEIHKITWENASRFFNWDPFVHVKREDATVGALRAAAADVDTTRMPRAEWRRRNEAAGIGLL
jgi:predicted TIM-barrel fold metal-dependent hydrolase